jgi:hypothetical protein
MEMFERDEDWDWMMSECQHAGDEIGGWRRQRMAWEQSAEIVGLSEGIRRCVQIDENTEARINFLQ